MTSSFSNWEVNPFVAVLWSFLDQSGRRNDTGAKSFETRRRNQSACGKTMRQKSAPSRKGWTAAPDPREERAHDGHTDADVSNDSDAETIDEIMAGTEEDDEDDEEEEEEDVVVRRLDGASDDVGDTGSNAALAIRLMVRGKRASLDHPAP